MRFTYKRNENGVRDVPKQVILSGSVNPTLYFHGAPKNDPYPTYVRRTFVSGQRGNPLISINTPKGAAKMGRG